MNELNFSSRTWFGTLTLSAEHQYNVLCLASAENALKGVDFNRLSGVEQFRERHRVISREITKYLKRVRKESRTGLRYIVVCEKHASGLPHFHCLVHQTQSEPLLTYRHLSKQWKLGFTKFNLVADGDNRPARYVTKYLTKSSEARVRASLGYGQPPLAIASRQTREPRPPLGAAIVPAPHIAGTQQPKETVLWQ